MINGAAGFMNFKPILRYAWLIIVVFNPMLRYVWLIIIVVVINNPIGFPERALRSYRSPS